MTIAPLFVLFPLFDNGRSSILQNKMAMRVLIALFVLILVHTRAWTSTTVLKAVGASKAEDTKLLFSSVTQVDESRIDPSRLDAVAACGEEARTADQGKNETACFSSSESPQYYLFSLQWTPDDCISKPVRDLWKWKDATLGDGRDFFVPKPKTITTLQNIFMNSDHHSTLKIEECSIISNCARFEILCKCKNHENEDDTSNNNNPIKELSKCFATQIILSQDSSSSGGIGGFSSWTSLFTQKMDVPNLVLFDYEKEKDMLSTSKTIQTKIEEHSQELEKYWTQISGIGDIVYYLSLVSAGIADRPNRPNRETLFQPFSSRDAHILLQLKRTKEVAYGPTINRILEYAIRAGKAVRNVDIVPEIKELQSYSQYSSEVPKSLSREVAQTATDKAIKPLVQECLETIQAQESSQIIETLRAKAEALASNPSELKIVRRMLHQPTMQLRKGYDVDQAAFLEELQNEICLL